MVVILMIFTETFVMMLFFISIIELGFFPPVLMR